jgi:hypothetical protein
MRRDTIADWQSLTQLYSEMSGSELYALNADLVDLTEMAQQVLRDEMKKRGLNEPTAAKREFRLAKDIADPRPDPSVTSLTAEKRDLPHEYTWKTLLCECNDPQEAWQIQEALKEAGIESWIEGPRSRRSLDMRNPHVKVAADQLEEARAIIAMPIPQAIVEQAKMEWPEYEPPVCPKCGTEDPVLESIDPVNTWLCEECGKQWTESVAD